MTQPGGAATHYGILFQAISTIEAAFTISSRGDADDPDTVTLTVEPRGGGGDAIAASVRRRTVIQFKSRSDYGTWSLNEIIDDALRDLYRAVPNEPDSWSEYLLITEGREGDIKEARRFFRECLRRNEVVTRDVAVEPFHLSAYVDEQAFRFNQRKDNDGERFLKALAMVPTARLTYKDLIRAEQA